MTLPVAEQKPAAGELFPRSSFIGRILAPGSTLTPKYHSFLNMIFVGVGLCACLLLFAWGVNIHTMIFSFLLLGLVITTNWFFSLLGEHEPTLQKGKKPQVSGAIPKSITTPSKDAGASSPAASAAANKPAEGSPARAPKAAQRRKARRED